MRNFQKIEYFAKILRFFIDSWNTLMERFSFLLYLTGVTRRPSGSNGGHQKTYIRYGAAPLPFLRMLQKLNKKTDMF